MIAPTMPTIYTRTDAAVRVVEVLRSMGLQPRWLVIPSTYYGRVWLDAPRTGTERIRQIIAAWLPDTFTVELYVAGYVTLHFDDGHIDITGWIPGSNGSDLLPQFHELFVSGDF